MIKTLTIITVHKKKKKIVGHIKTNIDNKIMNSC